MFGSNFFGFPYCGQGYAGIITPDVVPVSLPAKKRRGGIVQKQDDTPNPNAELFKRLMEEDNEILAIIYTFMKCR